MKEKGSEKKIETRRKRVRVVEKEKAGVPPLILFGFSPPFNQVF